MEDQEEITGSPPQNSILDHLMVEGLQQQEDFQTETPRTHPESDVDSTAVRRSTSRSPSRSRTRSPSHYSRSRSGSRSPSRSRSRSASERSHLSGSEEGEERDERMSGQSRSPSPNIKKEKKPQRSSRRSKSKKKKHHSKPRRKSKYNSKRSAKSRYFVMKSYDESDVLTSQQHSVWATQKKNEPILNEAFDDCEQVILFFSVNRSGHFQGYAKMTSSVSHAPSSIWASKDGRPSWGGTFGVDWKRVSDLPFSETVHLHNPWNENKPIKISRDGQELPGDVGDSLLNLFRTYDGSSSKKPNRRPPPPRRRPPPARYQPGPPRYQARIQSHSPPPPRRGRGRMARPRMRSRTRSPPRSRSRSPPPRYRRQERGYYYTRTDFDRMTAEQKAALIAYQRRILAGRTYGGLTETQRVYLQRLEQARRYRAAGGYPSAYRGGGPPQRYRPY